jgi:multiple sugar transport system substrate-binding protein
MRTPRTTHSQRYDRSQSPPRVRRGPVLVAAIALIVGACGQATTTATPTGSGTPATSAPGSEPPSGETVEIRWYCCLGGGDAPEQVEVEQQVAEEFNASHPNIRLTFEAVPYEGARDALATQIASGNGPDIVGPVGIGGAEAFHGQWLDLQPLIDSTGYDMSQFPEATVSLYSVGGEGQLGIPFAVYPSSLFYKKSLFEEAGLPEPPHEWNGTYTMPDGTSVPWDYDTVRQIAMLLTVDRNGKDATQEAFDPENIVQWGFEPQRDDIRQTGAYWEAGQLAGGDGGTTVEIPDGWATAWNWFYEAMWTDRFSMTGPQFESPELNPSDYPFFTGNVAMSQNYLWSTYGVADAGDDWDLAATPSYQGQTVAAFNADTFRILKDTKHPDEAFEVLTYLLGDASGTLLTTYGGMPARPEEQDAFFVTLQEGFTNQVDWNVAKEGVNYADVPNFESYMPAYNESLDLLITFGTKWQSTQGLNLDTEIADLKAQLQAIWDQEG